MDQALTECQKDALLLLKSPECGNVFITGIAGSGKSFLIQYFIDHELGNDRKKVPILSSTGSSAVLIGGRTFHSYFGLGTLQGGPEATIQKAMNHRPTIRRIKKAETIIIDEISMISGETLRTAENIARLARESDAPWGGIRIIAVGDFAQLPPVAKGTRRKDWAFLDPTWKKSQFSSIHLKTTVRTVEKDFLSVLNSIRDGQVNPTVHRFLNAKTVKDPDELQHFKGTRLFSLRSTTEQFNLRQLSELEGELTKLPTEYTGAQSRLDSLKRYCPIPEVVFIKINALVMLRQNDPIGRWVNGSIGRVEDIDDEKIYIQLLSGRHVAVERFTFSLQDGEGKDVATATNFPINLAYATTIHKSQGVTLDRALVDLERLWEPGQAYVALSRVRSEKGLAVKGWSESSIKTDPDVAEFYRSLTP